MAIEIPWEYSTADGRSMGEAIHHPRSFPVPLNKTSVTYDAVGGGAAVTVDPIYNRHMFVAQNAKGAATKFWHGQVGAAGAFFGTFGVFRFNPHAKTDQDGGVRTFRLGGPGEPEMVPVPTYLDYTPAALSEPAGEYWVTENYGAHLDKNVGANIVTGQVVGVPVHKGGAAALRSGQRVYAVDWWSVTVDPADVVETHEVGFLVDPLKPDPVSGLELWTVSIYHDSKLPSVPIA